MRFKLNLLSQNAYPVIPVNYQYPLSAVIYRILGSADQDYAAFLHDAGYQKKDSLKSFKLFTFSDIRTPFKIESDRFRLLTPQAELEVCFHLPQAAEKFIRGLFMNQQMEIADRKSKAAFTIAQIESLPTILTQNDRQELVLQPLSPVVSGKKDERGNYAFLAPEHPEFVQQLMYNWREKYKTVYGTDEAEAAFTRAGMDVIFYHNPPKSKLITIKADTDAETKIRGFTNFRLNVLGSRAALELLLNAGAGIYNSLGMGCVDVGK